MKLYAYNPIITQFHQIQIDLDINQEFYYHLACPNDRTRTACNGKHGHKIADSTNIVIKPRRGHKATPVNQLHEHISL